MADSEKQVKQKRIEILYLDTLSVSWTNTIQCRNNLAMYLFECVHIVL